MLKFIPISSSIYLTAVILLLVPYSVKTQSPVSPEEQLTNQDVSKIIELLGQQQNSPSSSSLDKRETDSVTSDSNTVAKLANPKALSPSQDDLSQSLALLSTLLGSSSSSSSSALSSDVSSLFGLSASPQSSTTTTTATTSNPKEDEAAQTLALLNSLLGSSSGGSTSSSSNSDASGLAALLSLAAAATPTQQKQQQSSTDLQSAALLTNLLLSSAGVGNQGATSTTGNEQFKMKQQDFKNFQNAGLNLDTASSNQLSGMLGLLGALNGGSAQPSLFNLGQQQQPNVLASLLGGGGAGGLASLLAAGASQQRPGLLSSLGGLASAFGSLSGAQQGDGKPRVRGVDTRLGVGYRFGENADAQVVWEIGPQLFTEPLTNEQKQILLQQQQQQQQQQLQRRQLQNAGVNRRMQINHKTGNANTASSSSILPTLQPHLKQNKNNNVPLSRRNLAVLPTVSTIKVNKPSSSFTAPFPQMPLNNNNNFAQYRPQQQPKQSNINSNNNMNNVENSKANYYAKKEANPRTNRNSQLTEYERWLLANPNRNQQQQQSVLNNNANNENKKDVFIFTKDNTKNIVSMRIHPRDNNNNNNNPRQVLRVGSKPMNNNKNNNNNLPSKFNSRMGASYYERYNPAADDSYLRRNAMVMDPRVREFEIEKERQEHLLTMPQMRHPLYTPQTTHTNTNTNNFNAKQVQPIGDGNRRISSDIMSSLVEKNKVFDLMQTYLVNGIQTEGNTFVRNFYRTKDQEHKKLRASGSPITALPPSPAQQLSATLGSGLIPSIKGFLGMDNSQKNAIKPTTEAPIVHIGPHIKKEDLTKMLNGGQEIDENSPSPSATSFISAASSSNPFPTQASEIFIDIENGEVSMRKPFGTMESFTPPPPEVIPEDSPKHVFKELQQQLAYQYEKVKMEQLKEAAKQRRKDAIAQGLTDPHDPLYLVSKYFELVEKEEEQY